MARDLNLFQAIGNLGRDPETRYTNSGTQVTTFSIAVGDSYKDKNGNKVESTEWINLVAFDNLAKICSEYLVKGSKVYISGKFKTDKYQDKDTGKDMYSTKIVLRDLQMLSHRQDNGQGQQQNQGQQYQQNQQQQGSNAMNNKAQRQGQSQQQGPNGMRHSDPSQVFYDSFDESIPL